jgi:hypothetical protein
VSAQDWLILVGLTVGDVDLCPFGFKSEPEKAQKDCRGCVELKNDLFWAIFGRWVEK